MNVSVLRGSAVAILLVSACSKTTPEPIAKEPGEVAPSKSAFLTTTATATAVNGGIAKATPTAETTAAPSSITTASEQMTVASVPVSPGDPVSGKWTMQDADKRVPGKGPLLATIDTSMGKIECKLLSEKAPLTVANFVGLATGARPWKDPDGKWVKKPAYDGTIFHRVIAGFMIQGGDAKGTGGGEPGYVIPDEVWPGAKHDRAGQLCMANRGANTNGAQFFITDAAAKHLDRGYTIFGECEPTSVVHEIATTPKGPDDRPIKPVNIKSVKITRIAIK
jgi:peptidyl-prolyl cis-trans isomerase A (cyclophilin A)